MRHGYRTCWLVYALAGALWACGGGDDGEEPADASMSPPDAPGDASVPPGPDGAPLDAVPTGDASLTDASKAPDAAVDAATDAAPAVCTQETITAGASPELSVPDMTTIAPTVDIDNAPSYIVYLRLRTFIGHSFSEDLDVALISPQGTRVVITTDNGGNRDNVFDGTIWDDHAESPVTDAVFTSGVTATSLVPESALAAFAGENPNGTWTLEVTDDGNGDVGVLHSWSLEIVGVRGAFAELPQTFSSSSAVSVQSGATVTSTITVADGLVDLCDVDVITQLAHTASGDIDMALISPSGTRVVLTTDNGAAANDVFNGTRWDDDANQPVSDFLFQDRVVATALTPEGALARFAGENANGTWTLELTDDAGGDEGTLDSWSIELSICECSQ